MNKIEQLIAEYCPDGVELKSIGAIFDIKNGYTPSKSNKEYWENGTVPWFRMEDIRLNGRVLNDSIQHITSIAVKKSGLIPANSLIMSTTATIGEHALLLVDALTNQQITSFTIKEDCELEILPKFVFYCFFDYGNWCRKNVYQGGGMPIINSGKLKEYLFPLPPLPVQEEIVRILDKFTELTAELEARKKQYEYYRDNLLSFSKLNGGGYLSANNYLNIKWLPLGEIAENLDSLRKAVTSGSREKGDIPYYGASGIVDYVKDFIFDGDYLLISEDGANLITRNTPIAFSVSGKSWVNNHSHVLKFKTYTERRFVEYYLNSIDLTPYISGAAQPKLNQKNLNNIIIPIPPLEEQERIVAILDKFDTLTNSITEGLPKEIELYKKQYEYYRDMLLAFPKS